MKVATLLEDDLDGVRFSIKHLDDIADAYEIRFDSFAELTEPSKIRALTRKPLIATCRRPTDGGKFQGDENERRRILEEALAAGFEYADVEGDTVIKARKGDVIRSHHDLRSTPPVSELVTIGSSLARGRGSLVKVACKVAAFEDTLNLIEATHSLRAQGIRASFMGLGAFPRAVAHLAGNEFTYGGGRRLQPGQPALREIARTLEFWGHPEPGRDLYLIAGRPISHSRSPAIHNAAFRALKIPAAFGAIELRTEVELALLIDSASRLGIRGLSVTAPFKEAAWARSARATPEARRAKSVNCIRIEDGAALGHNTDGLGAQRVLDRLLGPEPRPARILIIGTGGAARGLVSQIKNVEVVVAGRDRNKLRAIENEFSVGTVGLTGSMFFGSYSCLVNATAVEEPIKLNGFKGSVFDLHYGEHPTAWERASKSLGLKYAGGRELLLEQALPAFEFWTGRPPPREAMTAALGSSTSP